MLKHLELINFRNYKNYSIDFKNPTIFIGKNGVGKTNIIEAIYLLSTGRSWRTYKDSEVINWESDFARVIAKSETKDSPALTIEMILQKKTAEAIIPKQVKVNGVKKKLTEVLGKIPTVLFSPEEILLIDGAPQLRRRFLDILLCQIDRKYTVALLDLARIIRGRNKLLFYIKIGKSKENELSFWDEKLVVLGTFIIKKREKATEALNENLSRIYSDVAGENFKLKIKYKKSVNEETFYEEMIAQREREIEQTKTLLGPHRDDLVFMLEGKNINTFGSRGEYRSAVLAAKIAELEFLEAEKGEKPILLLDDIFSELDKTRRMHLAKIVEGQQTIITTTDLDHIERGLREKAKIVELEW